MHWPTTSHDMDTDIATCVPSFPAWLHACSNKDAAPVSPADAQLLIQVGRVHIAHRAEPREGDGDAAHQHAAMGEAARDWPPASVRLARDGYRA